MPAKDARVSKAVQSQHDRKQNEPEKSQPDISVEVGKELAQNALVQPDRLHSKAVLALQRKSGNQAVIGWMARRAIQPKLIVGAADDTFEQEADQVAKQVVNMSQPVVRREMEKEDESPAKPPISSIMRLVQCQENEGETQSTGCLAGSFEVENRIEQEIASSKGEGTPLPDVVRRYMEPRFGADFSGVRLHADNRSAYMNRSLGAQAFTLGQDIYLGESKYNPGCHESQQLIAHELTHTIQQSGGNNNSLKVLCKSIYNAGSNVTSRHNWPGILQLERFHFIDDHSYEEADTYAEAKQKHNAKKAAARKIPAPVAQAPQTPLPADLVALTIQVTGGHRDSKTFGVGELVKLSASPALPTSPKIRFEVVNGDAMMESGSDDHIRIGTRKGEVTLQMRVASGEFTGRALPDIIRLAVVVPDRAETLQAPGTRIRHTQGKASVGFKMWIRLLPNDVPFDCVEFREDVGTAVATGAFSTESGRGHAPTGVGYNAANQPVPDPQGKPQLTRTWVKVISDQGGQKNRVDGEDTVDTGDKDPNPPASLKWEAGSMIWPIKWVYRVVKPGASPTDPSTPVSSACDLMTARHEAHIDEHGKASIKKENAGPFETNQADPTVTF